MTSLHFGEQFRPRLSRCLLALSMYAYIWTTTHSSCVPRIYGCRWLQTKWHDVSIYSRDDNKARDTTVLYLGAGSGNARVLPFSKFRCWCHAVAWWEGQITTHSHLENAPTVPKTGRWNMEKRPSSSISAAVNVDSSGVSPPRRRMVSSLELSLQPETSS